MRVSRVLLLFFFSFIFSYAKVCEDYQYKLQEYETRQILMFKTVHKNATDDELWNIAAKECEGNKPTAIPSCIYLYKNILKQNFENKNVSKIDIINVLDNIIDFYIAQDKTKKEAEANFSNYKIATIAQYKREVVNALHDSGYFTKEQYKALNDLSDAMLMVSAFAACPDKYDPTKVQPFLPDDKINDACLCLLKQQLLIKEGDYLTATKISELLCKKI